jgi:hypothetical protein
MMSWEAKLRSNLERGSSEGRSNDCALHVVSELTVSQNLSILELKIAVRNSLEFAPITPTGSAVADAGVEGRTPKAEQDSALPF